MQMHISFDITRRHVKNAVVALFVAGMVGGAVAGCTTGTESGQQKETHTQQNNYDRLAAAQPAHQMPYSSTRATVNGWIDTWGKKGALSYVYIRNADGKMIGYYVLKGLPVSYCVSLTPTYQVRHSNGGAYTVPAPAMDGVYYNGSGSCDTYYGFDAVSGAYMEYTVGVGQNVLLYNKPLTDQPNVEPWGDAKVTKDGKLIHK